MPYLCNRLVPSNCDEVDAFQDRLRKEFRYTSRLTTQASKCDHALKRMVRRFLVSRNSRRATHCGIGRAAERRAMVYFDAVRLVCVPSPLTHRLFWMRGLCSVWWMLGCLCDSDVIFGDLRENEGRRTDRTYRSTVSIRTSHGVIAGIFGAILNCRP